MKRIFLILALIFMIIFPVFSQTGNYTTNEYFYLPKYGSFGTDEFEEYETYMEIADNAIKANETASDDENIEDVVGAMFSSNTETGLTLTYQDSDGTIDVVIGANKIVESMLKFVNTPNDEEIYTYEATTGDFEWHTLLELSIQPLESTLTDIADGTINENLVNTANPWADNEITNDPTVTIADTDDSTTFLLLAETITGAQKIKSDPSLTYDASTGTLGATYFTGDGSSLTNIGVSAATGLTIAVKEEGTGAITKGQAVYNSGSAGVAKPLVGLAHNDAEGTAHMIGLAAEDISQNGNGLVRVGGLITGVATLGVTDVNPAGETWLASDELYLSPTEGGLTNVRPTSGHIVEIGWSLYGSSNTDAILIEIDTPSHGIHVAADDNIILRMGDTDGSTSISIRNFSNTEVANIDDQGDADFNSLIVDVEIADSEISDTLTASILTGGLGGDLDSNNLDLVEVKTVQFNGVHAIGNSGSTETVDWQNGAYQSITIDEACVISFSNEYVGTLNLVVTYAGSFALTFGGMTLLEEGGIEIITTDATGVDFLMFKNLGTADTYLMGALLDIKD